ncbi:MAG: hypothetical protein ACI8XO_000762 [Verrucomicrobiales bacterium]|jgi:hypothetical protein
MWTIGGQQGVASATVAARTINYFKTDVETLMSRQERLDLDPDEVRIWTARCFRMVSEKAVQPANLVGKLSVSEATEGK